jgi:ABC-type transporter Mla MlaB component
MVMLVHIGLSSEIDSTVARKSQAIFIPAASLGLRGVPTTRGPSNFRRRARRFSSFREKCARGCWFDFVQREHLRSIVLGMGLAYSRKYRKVRVRGLGKWSAREDSGAVSKPMLKIVRSANSEAVVYFLSGRIDGEHIAELQSAFAAEKVAIKLDLEEVTRVDREGVPTLARWQASGIEFVNCPAYLRNWISRARTRKPTKRS